VVCGVVVDVHDVDLFSCGVSEVEVVFGVGEVEEEEDGCEGEDGAVGCVDSEFGWDGWLEVVIFHPLGECHFGVGLGFVG